MGPPHYDEVAVVAMVRSTCVGLETVICLFAYRVPQNHAYWCLSKISQLLLSKDLYYLLGFRLQTKSLTNVVLYVDLFY